MRHGLALALACLVLSAGYLALKLTAPQPGVTLANAQRVRCGMTLEQVEALFGEPYASEEYGKAWFLNRFWKSGDLQIEVSFSYGSQACRGVEAVIYNDATLGELWAPLEPVERCEDSWLDKVRRWLHLAP
jgi:hypothetical protein